MAITLLAAIAVRFVVQPELHRKHAFEVLEKSDSIQPPMFTMFGGRNKGDFDPVVEPAWFATRQHMARMLFIETVPWHEDCALMIVANNESAIRLARSCADLKAFATEERLSIFRSIFDSPNPPEAPLISFPIE